jgi:hypothetical protein
LPLPLPPPPRRLEDEDADALRADERDVRPVDTGDVFSASTDRSLPPLATLAEPRELGVSWYAGHGFCGVSSTTADDSEEADRRWC